jgi:glycosylphosphatidylinositol transamidase
MALLEALQKKLVKTGTIYKLIKQLPRISLLFTIFSIVFMLILPMDGQYRRTYISENALMPGQAHSFFRESEWNHVRGYRNEVVNMMNLSLIERNNKLQELLNNMGYKTDILEYIDPETGISKPTLYAIYHVPKGDDTEAMVITSPWYSDSNELNVGALSMNLGLARYLRRLSIWAKNIIIVFPEDGGNVLKNWVDSYHTTLENTGGSIESAIVIDCPTSSDYIGFIELEYVGINGQLPNLDFINTIVQNADNELVKISINGTPYGQLWTDDYFSRLSSMLNGIFDIASAGILNVKDHQYFSGWNIQAVTIRGKEGDSNDITSFGRIIDSTLRSVNNLLEKFHQSFFFYLLFGTRSFVSIGMYLPASGLSSASFLISSINSWVSGNNLSINVINNLNNFNKIQTKSLVFASLTFILIIFISTIFGILTSNLINNLNYFKLTYNYFIIPLLTILILPIINKFKINSDYLRSLNTIVLFFIGYTLIGLMILNFSLSLIIGIILSPINFIKYSTNYSIKLKLKNILLLILSCPAIWLIIFSILHKLNFQLDKIRNLIQFFEFSLLQKEIQNMIDLYKEIEFNDLINAPVELFIGLINGYKKVQCWTWLFICVTWIPAWISMVIIASFQTYPQVEYNKKNQ